MTGPAPSNDHDLLIDGDFPTIAVPKPVAAPPVDASFMGANPDATVPFVFGRRIAKGGMGAILEGDDRKLGRKIAVKVMLDANASAHHAQRFIQEAVVLGRLEHPNIVPIHDLGRDGEGALYYTMKLVKGRTLQHILDELRRRHPEDLQHYTLDRLLTVFRKVCDAMAFSHSQGIIHRDLKPENIMVGEFGEVLVMDWGISKFLGEIETPGLGPRQPATLSGTNSFTATMDGAVMGTPNYMSPEQALGKINELDERSDIFSLGGILYAILTLRPPVEGKDVSEVLEKVQAARITSPTLFGATVTNGKPTAKSEVTEAKKITPLPHMPGGKVPHALSAVAMKALTLDKAQRYQTVAAFSADIEQYQGGFATSAEEAGWFKRASLAIKRNKAASIGAATVLLVGSTLGTQAVLEGRRAERALIHLKASAPSLLKLAQSEAAMQQFPEALRDFDAVIELDPALAPARWQRAWVFIGMERWSEAADAVRLARQQDPSSAKLAAILPKLEEIAATDEAKRWVPERVAGLTAYLQEAGATGSLVALSAKLKLGAEARRQLVEQRVAKWLGPKAKFASLLTAKNEVELSLRGLPINTIEPLRGLPLDRLNVGLTNVSDLSPLQGMKLTLLDLENTKVADLSPVRGMKLTSLNLARTMVADISPIAGMPLREFVSSGTGLIRDFTPLRGAPLETLNTMSDRTGDLSFLTGAHLKTAHLWRTQINNLDFLRDAPLDLLSASGNPITDLSPLRGKLLTNLECHRTGIHDLSPLRGMPLKQLGIEDCPIDDYSPLLDLPVLDILVTTTPTEKLLFLRQHPTLRLIRVFGRSGVRPVAEVWAEYDAQQAAKK